MVIIVRFTPRKRRGNPHPSKSFGAFFGFVVRLQLAGRSVPRRLQIKGVPEGGVGQGLEVRGGEGGEGGGGEGG